MARHHAPSPYQLGMWDYTCIIITHFCLSVYISTHNIKKTTNSRSTSHITTFLYKWTYKTKMLGQTIVTDIITKAVHIHASQFHNDPDTWCEWIQGFLVCLKKKIFCSVNDSPSNICTLIRNPLIQSHSLSVDGDINISHAHSGSQWSI